MQQVIKENEHFIYYLFNLTMGGLYGLSLLTHLSYQFWNIFIWFGIIPSTWIYLISNKKSPLINLFSLTLFFYMFLVHTWNPWFNKAVILLNNIGVLIHADYKITSVYVCVFLPVFMYTLLFAGFTSKKTFKRYLITMGILSALIIIMFPISNMLVRYYFGMKAG